MPDHAPANASRTDLQSRAEGQASASDFIRQHLGMKAGDLVTAGQKAGLEFSKSLVYMVRQRQAKSSKVLRANAAGPKKARAAKSGLSASDFVRSQPLTMTPNDVVEAGKKAGIPFSPNLVYLVRGPRGTLLPSSPSAKRVTPVLAPVSETAATAARSASFSNEQELARLILEVGFERAETLLSKLRAALG